MDASSRALDIGNPEILYAVEYDGVEWHSTPEQRRHDRLRRKAVRNEGFESTSSRQARLRSSPRRGPATHAGRHEDQQPHPVYL
jgi:hypothetical protein